MYAIIETGGKQYRVAPGDTIIVEKLDASEGEELEINRVLAIVGDDGEVAIGSPLVSGARAVCEVVRGGKGPKVIVFKYKPKVKYRRKYGHRQPYTRLVVREIRAGSGDDKGNCNQG